jgi:hypothetical protein
MEDDVHSEYNQRWLDFLTTLPRRMPAQEAMALWGKFKNA